MPSPERLGYTDPAMAKRMTSRLTVITTRPSGQGVNLCRALRRRGYRAWNLPAVRLSGARDEEAARQALATATRGDAMIFISPAAVRHALHLWPRETRCKTRFFAVGAATARALERAGFEPVLVPQEATSEGLLALDELRQIRNRRIAIVGAAGGRALLGNRLGQRGARVQRVHVYRREPARLDARHWRALDRSTPPLLVTVTSAQTIQNLAGRLPAAAWQQLHSGIALVSSPRLANVASDLGFARIERARSATDAGLVAAIDALFSVP